ncbi:MAG: LPXTG cell wall anchor domain-containing protein [Microgenomates group bacterium]
MRRKRVVEMNIKWDMTTSTIVLGIELLIVAILAYIAAKKRK